MLNDLYINSTGIISAAGNNGAEDFLAEAPVYNANQLLCKEPDYTGIIPPMQLRRMSKAVRMGIAASKIALKNAGIEKPDALSVGTAMGCLYDTEQFLSKMVAQDEQMLTPTSFIQSTHNTVAGQIALVAGCHGHNLTFAHRGHSFEHALVNAALYLEEHPEEKLLAGGIDEMTDTTKEFMQRLGVYTRENMTPDDMIYGATIGSIAAEGASFFVVSKKPSPQSLCIKKLSLFIARNTEAALSEITTFLGTLTVPVNDIDIALLGMNGDTRSHDVYEQLNKGIFENTSRAAFKHVCGEYPTASAFALGLLTHGVKNDFPGFIFLDHPPKRVKNIILINNFLHHYSCWHIEVVG